MTTPAATPIITPEQAAATAERCKERLEYYISDINQKPLLKPMVDPLLADATKQAETMVTTLISDKYNCSPEMAIELSVLTLYDLVVLIDDSSSMKLAENAKRIATLEKTLEQIADIYNLANPSGIKSVRFLNHRQGKKDVKKTDVKEVVGRCAWIGLTMIGTELRRKILNPFVLSDTAGMKKPLLVMIITDGQVEGEKKDLLEKVILDCMDQLNAASKPSAVAFHFSRVGNDEGAAALLKALDDHKAIGDHVDCLPTNMPLENINEDDEAWKLNGKWEVIPKLLLGAIMPTWDNKDDDFVKIDADAGKDVKAAEFADELPEDD